MNLLMIYIAEEKLARKKKLHWIFAPIILALMGVVIALTVLPEKTHADQTVYSDVVAAAPAWYNGSEIINGIGEQTDPAVNPTITYALSIPVQRGNPYSQTETIRCYTSATYATPTACDGAAGATTYSRAKNVTADGTMQIVAYDYTGTIAAGVYVALDTSSDGGNVYGSCTAGVNIGGNNQACTPSTDGVAYYTGAGAPPLPTNLTTRIVYVSPADNTATSTQITPQMTYWAASTTQLNVLNATIYRMDTGGNQVFATSTFITPPSDDYATWTTFGGEIWLSDNASYKVVYTGYDEHNFVNNLIFATTTTFYTGTNGWFETLGASSTESESLHALATSTCDVFNISGCFQNALVWAFVPSGASLSALQQTGASLATVKPFGYFVQLRSALSPSTTTAALADLSQYTGSGTAWGILFFQPLRTILSIIFWVANLVMLYFYWRTKEV